MSILRCWLTWLALTTVASAAEPAAKSAPPVGPPAPPKAQTSGVSISLNDFSLPARTIVVVVDEIHKAIGMVPRSIVLSAEEYQALKSELEKLKRQVKPAAPMPPSKCLLKKGRVEGNVARFEVEYHLVTQGPDSWVTLGCQRASVKDASLDGQMPLLSWGPDGLLVHVDKPGSYALKLELEVPLGPRGNKGMERGFDFSLPRAAITTLEDFTFPGPISEVRLSTQIPGDPGGGVPTRRLEPKAIGPQQSRLENVLLGATDRLELSWRSVQPAPVAGPALVAAEANIDVLVEESRVVSEIRLTLEVLRGEKQQWLVQLPPQARLDDRKVSREPLPNSADALKRLSDDECVDRVDGPDPKTGQVAIYLKKNSGPARLYVYLKISQPLQGKRAPVGPVVVADALQHGTMVVSAPANLRVWCFPDASAQQVDVPEEGRQANAVAAYSYSVFPPANPAKPPLEIEIDKGAIDLRLTHELELKNDGWLVKSRFAATSVQTTFDRVEVNWPAGYQLTGDKKAFGDVVDEVVVDVQKQTALVKLTKQVRGSFNFTLVGKYPLSPEARKVHLPLPTALTTTDALDRGGHQATATVPEGWELLPAEANGKEGVGGERTRSWKFDQAPGHLDLAWRSVSPELAVQCTADVTLTRERVQVRQHLQFRLARENPELMQVEVPAILTDHIEVDGGGELKLNAEEKGKNSRYYLRSGPGAPKNSFTLVYSLSAAEVSGDDRGDRDSRRTIPLVRPRDISRYAPKVRIWSESDTYPVAAGAGWDEAQLELVSEPNRDLPVMVLRGSRPDLPLTLTLKRPDGAALAPVVAERALLQGMIAGDGRQLINARFQLSRLQTHTLNVDLPLAPAQAKLEVFLGGKRLTWGPGDVAGHSARLKVEPSLFRLPMILEIRYERAPAPIQANVLTTFVPPLVQTPGGSGMLVRQLRWQVGLLPGRVGLVPEAGGFAEQTWGWRGVLLAPKAALASADLERWPTEPTTSAPAGLLEGVESTLLCRRANLEPLAVVQVPDPVWLLVCSLAVLALGLVLGVMDPPRIVFWALLTLLILGLAAAVLWQPTALAAVVYGCEPGLAVLAAILGIQWLMHRRYRRQVVFLPGFTRMKPESSVKENKLLREPSTVDAPAKPGSSVARAGSTGSGSL